MNTLIKGTFLGALFGITSSCVYLAGSKYISIDGGPETMKQKVLNDHSKLDLIFKNMNIKFKYFDPDSCEALQKNIILLWDICDICDIVNIRDKLMDVDVSKCYTLFLKYKTNVMTYFEDFEKNIPGKPLKQEFNKDKQYIITCINTFSGGMKNLFDKYIRSINGL